MDQGPVGQGRAGSRLGDPAVASIPSVPRPVAWRMVWHRRWGALLLGVLLIAAGVIWIASMADLGARPLGDVNNPLGTPMGFLVLPGVVSVALWVRAALRLKVLLTNGVAAAATLVYQQRMLIPLVRQHRLAYDFVDADGTEHRGFCWVTERSPVYRCVRLGALELVAVHDAARPGVNHLVCAETFAPAPTRVSV